MRYEVRSCALGCFLAVAAASFAGCGGGRVVVVPSPAVPTAVVPEAAVPGSAAVVVTVPETPALPAEETVAASRDKTMSG